MTANVTHWQGNTRQITIGPVRDAQGNFFDLSNAPTAVRWWLAKRATSTGPDIFVMKSLSDGITLQNNAGQWSDLRTVYLERIATALNGKKIQPPDALLLGGL
jgi:hypothetical protein